jgi:thiamine-monophosphate kinase
MGEFAFINQFFRHACVRASALNHPQALGIGDDAALLSPIAPDQQVVVTTDTLVEGRHYWADVDPQALGHKVLAVSLSDLAAMGALPWAFTLSVCLRSPRDAWVSSFMKGMSDLAQRARIDLIGGDTVGLGGLASSPESFCVTALGLVPVGQALRRDGLQVGDRIWVSGDLGEGQWAVAHHLRARKLLWPEPRLDLGQALRGIAHAAIDVSDGMSSELAHLVFASRALSGIDLQAEITLPALSDCLGPSLLAQVTSGRMDPLQACRQAASSGDEYELLFSAPEAATSQIQHYADQSNLRLTAIGWVRQGKGAAPESVRPPVVWLDAHGRPVAPEQAPLQGFDHFAASA